MMLLDRIRDYVAARVNEVSRHLLIYSMVSSTMFFVFGYDIVLMLLLSPFFTEGKNSLHDIVVYLPLLSILGAFAGGVASDFFGRRVALIMGGAIHILGATSSHMDVPYFIAGRLLMSIGSGFFLTAQRVYLVEIAPPRCRGLITSFPQIFMDAGYLVGTLVFILYTVFPSPSLSAVSVAFSALLALTAIIATYLFLPETPSWLVRRGRMDEARRVIHRCTICFVETRRWHRHLLASVMVDIPCHRHRSRIVFGDIFRRDGALYCLSLIVLPLLQPFSGESTFPFLSHIVLAYPRHSSDARGYVISLATLALRTIITFFFGLFAHWVGRRILCLTTIGLIGAVQMFLGIMRISHSPESLSSAIIRVTSLACCLIIQALFSSGLGPIGWVHGPESSSFRLRAQGSGVGVAAHMMARFIEGLMLCVSFDFTTGCMFLVNAAIMICLLPLLCISMRETGGHFLEDIDHEDIQPVPVATSEESEASQDMAARGVTDDIEEVPRDIEEELSGDFDASPCTYL